MSGAATGDGRLELDDHGDVVDVGRPRPVPVDLGGVDVIAHGRSDAPESRSHGGAAPGRRGHLRTMVTATAVGLAAASGLVWSGQPATYSTRPAAAAAGSHDDTRTRGDVSGPRRAAERGRATSATFRDPATGAVVMAYSPRS